MSDNAITRIVLLSITLTIIPLVLIVGEYFSLFSTNHLVSIPIYFTAAFLVALFLVHQFLSKNKTSWNNQTIARLSLTWIITTAVASLMIKMGVVMSSVFFTILLAGTLFIILLALLSIITHEAWQPDKGITLYPFTFIVFMFTVIGLFLRVYHLGNTPPVTDEFYHLLAAKRYLLEGHFDYTRGIYVTYLVSFVFELFNGTSVYLARFMPAIAGTAAIPLIYILWRRINHPLGVITAVLISVMPLAIGMSRFVREYSFLLLYLILHLSLVFHAMKYIKHHFVRSSITLSLLILFPVLYYIFIEDSNFIPMLMIYTFIALLITTAHTISLGSLADILNKYKLRIIAISLLSFVALLYLYSRVAWLVKINMPSSFFDLPSMNYFNALLSPDFSPWGVQYFWFSGSHFPTFFIIGLCFAGVLLFWKNKYYQTALGVFLITLITFTYFVDRYYAIRYIYYIIPFYTLLIACGIYATVYSARVFGSKTYQIWYLMAMILLGGTLFSLTPTWSGLKNEAPEVTDTKKELHSYDYSALFEKLNQLGFKDGDNIIASDGINNGLAYYLSNYPFIRSYHDDNLLRYALKNKNGSSVSLNDMHEIYAYHYDVPSFYAYPCIDSVCTMPENERLQMLMQRKSSGWFLMDKDRNKNWNLDGFPLGNFMLGEVSVSYLGSSGGDLRGIDIYLWTYPAQPPHIEQQEG